MKCRKCGTANPESSVYCISCGQPLIRKSRARRTIVPWYVFLAGLGALFLGFYFIIKVVSHSPSTQTISHNGDTRMAGDISDDKYEPSLIIGGVVVKDLNGKEIYSLASALLGNNWVAVPVWSLVGGKNVAFQFEGSGEISLVQGVWENGDPILLMKLRDAPKEKTARLAAWRPYEPLEWHPYLKKNTGFPIEIPRSDKRGSFSSFPLPYEIQEAGVFKQDGNIVGWAFPEYLDRAYLWLGSGEDHIKPNMDMNRFLVSVLPAWREVIFDDILSGRLDIPPARKLETLAQGLGKKSSFSEKDIPEGLRSSSIIEHMHSLASKLIEAGSAADVSRVLDEQTIRLSRSLMLVKDAVLARVESEDYRNGIQFLERIDKTIGVEGIAGIDRFHADLYKDWLRKILNQGSYFNGMVAFEEAKRLFPEDIELHLLGVEMSIKNKNWSRARDLLQMRDYPETMREWVGKLENKIQELQENEGAVTVRFNPGTRHISVNVFLNGPHAFRFILDTGATTCSIPSGAVDSLGIDIDQTTPVRLVSTAGGIAEIYEVKLKSVELEGLRVFGVEALVIDIPGYPNYGLLGQNFLNNFHIEIDNRRGILRLKKK